KRNHDFHALFETIPKDDQLVEDYGCALQKEILVQGRIYISETHLCFNANIFGWVTKFCIAFSDIVDIEKRTTAIFIPNAINITTSDNSKYLFASFLSRDQAFNLMMDVWKYNRSLTEATSLNTGSSFSSSSGMVSDDEETVSEEEDDQPGEKEEASLPAATIKSSKLVKEKTECACGDDHYSTTVMDQVYDGTLEAMYSLLYTSGFMKKFLTEDEELSDVVIGEWQSSEDKQQIRHTSYIKPLNGAIGPKKTKCLQTEQVIHYDLVSSVTMLTTTQTPDVPSGGSFVVKTRTCMTWAGPAKVRILVTVMVDFTKSSWIKSTIEKASVDGQVSFYQDLNTCIRQYIKEHPSEFSLDGKHFKGKQKKRRTKKKHHHYTTLPAAADQQNNKNWVDPLVKMIGSITASHLILLCLVTLVGIQLYMA
ncbi:GRAM domain-containing protein, partial [Chlamydoabsidia padenii]